MIQVGTQIEIKDLFPKLRELGFGPGEAQMFHDEWNNSITKALCIWVDDDYQTWVTVDLCCEIPIECCHVL
jgi:hypothetical protein